MTPPSKPAVTEPLDATSTPTPTASPEGRLKRRARWVLWIMGGSVALFLLVQAVPYGRSHTNPPTTAEPTWNSPETRELAARACFDCHSNLTTWPWYSNIAPVSWLVQRDVTGGRSALNFSDGTSPRTARATSPTRSREDRCPRGFTR